MLATLIRFSLRFRGFVLVAAGLPPLAGARDGPRRSDIAALRAFLAAEETGTRETTAP